MRRSFSLCGFLFAALLLCLFLGGCGKAQDQNQSESDSQKLRIGFSMATLLEDRWLQDREIFQARARQRGMEVIIRNANRDSNVQYQQVMELLEQDIDVLVLAPNDSEREARCVKLAKEKGVPVIIYDRFILNSDADVYVSFDNEKVGNLMAEYLLKQTPKGGYLLVNGPQSDHNCLMIRDGYMKVLQPYLDKGDIYIVEESWTDGWVRELAYDFVSETTKSRGSEINAVICSNDSLAWGASEALTEARILEQTCIVGMDADLAACRRIVADKQLMTVYKPISLLVEESLNLCEVLAKNEVVDTTQTLFDGQYDIPHVTIDVQAVTKETIKSTVIADGFHLEEEVYSK